MVGSDFEKIVGGSYLRGQWLRYGVDELVSGCGFEKAITDHFKNQIELSEKEDKIYYTDGHFSNYGSSAESVGKNSLIFI